MSTRTSKFRKFELILLGAAVLLLATYAIAEIHRTVSAKAGLREFDLRKADNGRSMPAPAPDVSGDPRKIDFTDWSEKRIRAYLQTLTVAHEDLMGVLSVPRLNLRVPIIRGTDEFALNRGVGWVPGTAWPGRPGNIGVAGHRDGFFRILQNIAMGDEIKVETNAAATSYSVDELEIVKPDNVSVLNPRAADSVTLITCYPFYFVGDAPLRFIVHARRQQTLLPAGTQ